MKIVRATLLNAVSATVTLSSSLVLNKALAVFVGPTGYALIGQFQNVAALLLALSGGGMAGALTKCTAEHFDNEPHQHALWRTAVRLSLWGTFLAAVLLFLSRDILSEWFFRRGDLPNVFVCYGIALPTAALNALLLGIINGRKEIATYVKANIAGSLVTFGIIGLLAMHFGVRGALFAIAATPGIAFITTAALAHPLPWLEIGHLWGSVESKALRQLSAFAAMTLTAAVCLPISQLLVRYHLLLTLGLQEAGYWQAITKISEAYLMLVTLTLSTYYLPRIAEIREARDLKAEIFLMHRFAMPLAAAGALVIYLFREQIVLLALAREFLPVAQLFGWQMAGDVVKIASWIHAYALLGRGAVRVFVISEVVFSASFVAFVWIFVGIWGLQGATIAYLVNYMLYFLTTAVLVRREIVKLGRTSRPLGPGNF